MHTNSLPHLTEVLTKALMQLTQMGRSLSATSTSECRLWSSGLPCRLIFDRNTVGETITLRDSLFCVGSCVQFSPKHNIYLVAMTALYSVTLNKAKHSPPHAAWHPTSCRTHSSDSILYLYCMYCTRTSSPWHSLLKKWRTQERPLVRREVDRPWRDLRNSTSRLLFLAFYRDGRRRCDRGY